MLLLEMGGVTWYDLNVHMMMQQGEGGVRLYLSICIKKNLILDYVKAKLF
jgi:hypothetical protein